MVTGREGVVRMGCVVAPLMVFAVLTGRARAHDAHVTHARCAAEAHQQPGPWQPSEAGARPRACVDRRKPHATSTPNSLRLHLRCTSLFLHSGDLCVANHTNPRSLTCSLPGAREWWHSPCCVLLVLTEKDPQVRRHPVMNKNTASSSITRARDTQNQ